MPLKDTLLRIARERGVFIGRTTENAKVQQVISQLRPRGFTGSLKRIGPNRDGGYLVPDDLEGISACISPGVSFESGFDLDIANRNIPVFMMDASVDGPAVKHDNFNFYQTFLGPRTESNFVTIDDFYNREISPNHPGDLLLQMDIEGAEWDVVATISDALLKRFRIMVLELHDLGAVFDRFAVGRIHLALSRLSKFHEVVHLHPNNIISSVKCKNVEIPRLLEVTYYRKDRSNFYDDLNMKFPNALDYLNVPSNKPVDVPRAWLHSR